MGEGCVATACKTWPGYGEMEPLSPQKSRQESQTKAHWLLMGPRSTGRGKDQSGFSLSSMAEASFVNEAPEQMPITSLTEPVVPQTQEETWAEPPQEKWN